MTGQFGKNHLGDRDEICRRSTVSTSSSAILYHLNAEEEPENPDYPRTRSFKKKFGPRGVIHYAVDPTARRRSRAPAR